MQESKRYSLGGIRRSISEPAGDSTGDAGGGTAAHVGRRAGVGALVVLAVLAIGLALASGVVAAGETSAPDCSVVAYEPNSSGYYEVGNVTQLQCIGDDDHGPGLDADYVLVSDIDASATERWNDGDGFEPIGECRENLGGECQGSPFGGKFDGNGHTISNLIVDSDEDQVGLFGGTDGAEITHVHLESIDVSGGIFYTGGLVGYTVFTDVSDVSVQGSVSGDTAIGGVVGYAMETSITDSTVEIEARGNSVVGGAVGEIHSGTVTRTTASGDSSASIHTHGGIAGSSAGTITESVSHVDLDGGNDLGRLVGVNDGTVSDSYVTGAVEGSDTVGGLVGSNDGVVSDSYWDTQSTGQSDSASGTGLSTREMTGDRAGDTMFEFGETWTVADDDHSGDGYVVYYPVLQDNEQDPAPSGTLYVRGDGDETPYEIETWYHLDNVRENLDANFVLSNDLDEDTPGYGELAGENANDGQGFKPIGEGNDESTEFAGEFDGDGHVVEGLTIDRPNEDYVGLFAGIGGPDHAAEVRNVGLVKTAIVGGSDTGGLVGANYGIVAQSSVTGDVHGDQRVGGLIGTNGYAATVSDSYATADVRGDGTVGGLVGQNVDSISSDPDGTIERSYATGEVNEGDTSGNVGGLVGSNSGDVTDSYWDTQTTGQSDSAAGEGLETAQMHGLNATVSMDGFDFDDTWLALDDYPVQSWQVVTYDLALDADEIDAGGTTEATVTVGLVGGTVATASEGVSYTTDGNVSVEAGTVTGVNAGPDTVMATGGGHADSAAVTVFSLPFEVEFDELPADADADTVIETEATVTGNSGGSEYVAIEFDGEEIYNESIDLGEGENKSIDVAYDVPADVDTGTVEVRIASLDDDDTATVDVHGYETVSGTVTDGVTGETLSGVDVTIDDGIDERTIETDESGGYDLEVINDRNVTISATATASGPEGDEEITGLAERTVNGQTSVDLELFPELAGEGTAQAPYEISNVYELQSMNHDTSAHYVLVGDVDASASADWNDGDGFDPIGVCEMASSLLCEGDPFEGSFDGNGYAISNLTTSGADDRDAGLFGWNNGEISNVTLTDVHVEVTNESTQRVGAVAGAVGGENAGGTTIGGDDGAVSNVSVSGTVHGEYVVGGAVGYAFGGEVTNSSSSATVTGGDGPHIGGLLGGNEGATIADLYATGSVSGDGGGVGGLIGTNTDVVTKSYATGPVSGGDDAGGLVGTNWGTVTDSYWNEDHGGTAVDGVGNGQDTATALTVDQLTGVNATEYMDALDFDATWIALDDESPALAWEVDNYTLELPTELEVGETANAAVHVDLRDGSSATATEASTYAATGNVSVEEGTVVGETFGTGSVTASAATLSDEASLLVLGSSFAVDIANVPQNVGAGESLAFDVIAHNVGTGPGEKDITVEADGREVLEESVMLEVGEERTLEVDAVIPSDADTGPIDLNASTPDDATSATVDVNARQTLSGTVTDGVSGETIEGASVEIDGEAVTTTAADGSFEATIFDGWTHEMLATATVDASDDPEITGSKTLTVAGNETVELTLWPALAGEGTETEPYLVSNAYELQAISQELSANYTLASDVNASDTSGWNDGDGFEPIGEYHDRFAGSLDGSGHIISDLRTHRDEGAGLFGDVDTSGTVENVHLENVSVQSENYAGGVAGYNRGTISNTSVTGTVDGSWDVGGLTSSNVGTVSNVTANVTVSGSNTVGGIVGWNQGPLEASSVTGTVDASNSNVGGAVARNAEGGSVTNVTSRATVNGTAERAGGLVGWNYYDVTDAYATGTVTGEDSVGGLIGHNDDFRGDVGSVQTSFATGTVTAKGSDPYVGGLVGESTGGSVTDSYWDTSATTQTDGIGSTADDGVTGLETAQMTGVNATQYLDGLDFTTTWTATNTYPRLASEVESIVVDPATVSLEPGETTDIAVELDFVDDETVDATEVATLTSSDTSVATVENATIEAIDDGATTVAVTAADHEVDIRVDVESPRSSGSDSGSRSSNTDSSSSSDDDDESVDGDVRVVGLAIDETDPGVGDVITATVTVENPGGAAATYRGTLELDGESIAEEERTVEAGETTTYTISYAFDEPGSYTFSASGESVTIVVADDGGESESGEEDASGEEAGETRDTDESSTGPTDDGDSDGAADVDDETPGFGLIAAVVALFCVLLFTKRRG